MAKADQRGTPVVGLALFSLVSTSSKPPSSSPNIRRVFAGSGPGNPTRQAGPSRRAERGSRTDSQDEPRKSAHCRELKRCTGSIRGECGGWPRVMSSGSGNCSQAVRYCCLRQAVIDPFSVSLKISQRNRSYDPAQPDSARWIRWT